MATPNPPRKRAGGRASSASPGELAVRFINNLTLVGDYFGQRFRLRDWQASIVRRLFGTLLPDGRRQYRRMFLALPRKQAKTTLAAGMAAFLLFGEGVGKGGQQTYSASGDRAQASLIFRTLASMIRADPELDRLCHVYESYKRIEFPALGNTFEALSSEAPLKHGLSPSTVIFDEVHVLPDRELHDTLTTGFGARKEPLTVYITTAGWNRHSLCYELWQHAERVRDGVIEDPTTLPILYAAKPEEDWTSEEVWRRVMPALGDFCSLEFIRDECRRAKELPSYENTFRQLYLNQWTEQATRWLSLDAWDLCRADFAPHDFLGRRAYAGLDCSSTIDLSAESWLFPNDLGGYDILPWFWLPGESAVERERRDKVPYPVWVRQGHIYQTGGRRIDHAAIRDKTRELARDYDLVACAYDPPHAQQLATELYEDGQGLPMIACPNTFNRLNEPSKTFERLIAERKIRHNGHPVLRWCVANVATAEKAGMILPSKVKSNERIDGVAASVMGLAAAAAAPDDGGSVYETRGLVFL